MRYFVLFCLMSTFSTMIAVDMSSILVVIDMQKKLTTSKSSIAHVVKLIKEYKVNERPILFVKLPDNGDLYDELNSVTKDYKYRFEIVKDKEDGSQEVMDFFERSKMNPDLITIVGTYTCACVYKTTVGLSKKIPANSSTQILIDPQGCHCHAHCIEYSMSYGKLIKRYNCMSKEEKYQELNSLPHTKVKSFEDAPKRKTTKDKCRLRSVLMDDDLVKCFISMRNSPSDKIEYLNLLDTLINILSEN